MADAQRGRGLLGERLVRLAGMGVVAGRALTADCEDGSAVAVLTALEEAQPGDVLCIAGPGPTAYLGDLLMAEIEQRGVAAVIVDGYVRDVDSWADGTVSCHARGVTPIATGSRVPGRPMVPVALGATVVEPGDWVVADGDGAVAVPAQDVDEVSARAEELAEREERVLGRIRAGATLIEAFSGE